MALRDPITSLTPSSCCLFLGNCRETAADGSVKRQGHGSGFIGTGTRRRRVELGEEGRGRVVERGLELNCEYGGGNYIGGVSGAFSNPW
jgi:hypothetical protein